MFLVLMWSGSYNKKSMQTNSKPTGLNVDQRSCSVRRPLSAHAALHVLIFPSTAWDILGQKNLDLTKSRVLSIPKCLMSSWRVSNTFSLSQAGNTAQLSSSRLHSLSHNTMSGGWLLRVPGLVPLLIHSIITSSSASFPCHSANVVSERLGKSGRPCSASYCNSFGCKASTQ